MSPIDPEFLLRELARIEETGGEEPLMPELPPELLAAYRSGALGPDDAGRLERWLAASPAAREQLAAAAGVALARPSGRVRQAVLAPAPPSRPLAAPVRRRWPGVVAAAAAMLALAVGLTWRSHPPLSPPLPAFEITLSGGLASDRAKAVTGPAITVKPHSRVTLAFHPRQAVSGLEFGLYRRDGGKLVRLRPGGAIRQVEGRGAAEWTARAADLVGTDPGEHPLWAVVARRGDLPAGEEVTLAAGPERALAAGGRRLVQPLKITLRARGEVP